MVKTMEKQLLVFNNKEFGEVRVVMIDGTPWFVGMDVAVSLGYKDAFAALKQHVDDEDKLVWQITSAGQKRDATVINESGLYSLIFRSNLPKAREFKHWVTSEVLLSIRKTGSYSKDAVSMLLGQDLRPACIYALELSDGTVKIGVARNLKKRINGVARSAHLRWLNVYRTSFAPFSFMRSVVQKCHKAFADKWLHGEFFAADFYDVCKELYRHERKIESALAFYENQAPLATDGLRLISGTS